MIAKRIVTVLVLLAALCMTIESGWASPPPRNFPANAMRGVLTATVYPQIVINGQTMVFPDNDMVTVQHRLGACKPGDHQINN